MADTIKLVTFGRGGDTAYCTGNATISGYGRPDRPHAGESCERHPIEDGTPALDLLPALETDEGFRHALRGPMVDVNLADDEVDRCPDPSPIFAAAVSGNQFGTLLAMQSVAKAAAPAAPGPLDSVSRSAFIAGWLAVGARLGHYQNGRIVWN